MQLFKQLRVDLDVHGVAALRRQVSEHYAGLVKAQLRNELIAIDIAELLSARLDGLLATSHLMEANQRAQLVGAARYFISVDDAMPDLQSCTGLDDDLEIFNHVMIAIDRPDLVISE